MIRGRGTTRAMHRWLDGKCGEADARREAGDAAQVEMWKRLESQAARFRETRAPAGFAARIMAALPPDGTPGTTSGARDALHAGPPAA